MGVSNELEVADDGKESLLFRPALEPALEGCDEASLGTDLAWPLLARKVLIGAGRRGRESRDLCFLVCCSREVASTPST